MILQEQKREEREARSVDVWAGAGGYDTFCDLYHNAIDIAACTTNTMNESASAQVVLFTIIDGGAAPHSL